MRIFQKNSYISLNFLKNETKTYRIMPEGSEASGIKVSNIELGDESRDIYLDSPTIVESNPLLAELKAFVNSIRTGEPPLVSGEDGLNALDVATKILSTIESGIHSAG